MGLETGTYISDLNSSNPTASDNVSQGDDHIRFVKSTILASFPNITGAMTMTQAQLNQVVDLLTQVRTEMTPVVVTSQTTVSFTGIPSWAGQIWCGFSQASLTAVDTPRLQLGDSGGLETAGYVGGEFHGNNSANIFTGTTLTSGFTATSVALGTDTVDAVYNLHRVDDANNTWQCQMALYAAGNSRFMGIVGTKSLSSTLTQLQFNLNGAESFDGGTFYCTYAR